MSALTSSEILNNIKLYSLIQGSPESTYGKNMHDGALESHGDFTRRSRKEINYHNLNGTDITSIVRTNVSGVVGAKINIQSRNKKDKINEDFEALLKMHGDKENFEVTGRWHRDEAWRMIVAFATLQGGIIIRHHYNSTWAIPYRMELVGIDMIDNSKNNRIENVQNGLKKDSYGRVVGIYLYDSYDKRTSSIHTMENMDYVVFTWVSLSQYTAVSRLTTILQTIDSTSQYTESEVRAAMERAKNGVYWHTQLYDTILEALNEEFRTADADGRTKLDEARSLIERLAQQGVGLSGATATPKDDTITQIDNKTDTVFETISNQSQKKMASAMGGSQVSTYRDIEKGNYASIKAAISFDEEECKIVFNNLENYVINQYLRRLFIVGVEKGFISLSIGKFFKTEVSMYKYFKWDILRTSQRVINEKDYATATKTNLETRVTTRGEEIARRGGDQFEQDTKQIMLDIKIELERVKMYKVAGLELPKIVDGKEVDDTEEKIDNKLEENSLNRDGEK